ncbi:hypothetical protein NJG17_08525 [Stenotrophomonas maltophilia]|uniref:hypothetical protein n=1 Tax=Stenotrophomonas maltophilia TaxID=40324 RepID=UPI0011315998|nr:hypothetical protein [Stenotrophomonas maltophilia]MCO7499941.1 hypothetical protein [Stenotrophomonas maltophilia]HDS1140568.1 hypothetical protein [Stenotrophomonas maltophilia]HEL3835397.1 hypothetical protein [Stenotrophomonas maltophilia]HEL3844633.1 hypothetical protein [Stenotrophomonas maltophilia]HEL4291284.1 hypothetical protein [Stenotrophomonas maltophilia]
MDEFFIHRGISMLKRDELKPGIIVYACVDALHRNNVDTKLRVIHPLLCLGVNDSEGVWAVVTSMETRLSLKTRWKIGPATWINKRSFIDPNRPTIRIPNTVLLEAAEAGEAGYYHDGFDRPGVKPNALQSIVEALGIGDELPTVALVNINGLSIAELEQVIHKKREEQRKADLVLVLTGIAKDSGYDLTKVVLSPRA